MVGPPEQLQLDAVRVPQAQQGSVLPVDDRGRGDAELEALLQVAYGDLMS
jgi:hypothetical protein